MGQKQLRSSEPSVRLLLFGCMALNVVPKDDTVVVDSNVSFNSLKVGDIIAFKTYGTNDSGQHETVASRVHEIRSDPNNGQRRCQPCFNPLCRLSDLSTTPHW